jgi:predicted transcriptional regulator
MDSSDKELFSRFSSKPNRVAIIRFIGERGEVSFKELKAKLNLGVGTLYYHLDGLSEVVTQNKNKQYALTERGKRIYDVVKNMEIEVKSNSRRFLPKTLNVIRETIFFESQIERLAVESMSNLSVILAILLVGSVLAALTRIEPTIFFIRSRGVAPNAAFYAFFFSWLAVFVICVILTRLLWKAQRNMLGLATASALAFIPITFITILDGIRRIFAIAALNPLFQHPYFLIIQILIVLWASYILAISLRSSVGLNLEKSLVVTLTVVLINLGYLWIRPLIFVPIR